MATKKHMAFEQSAKDKEAKRYGKEGSKKENAADKKQMVPYKKGGKVC